MVFDNFFKKPVPIISPEDTAELLELQRQAYMTEARKIIEEKGKQLAREQLGKKEEKYGFK